MQPLGLRNVRPHCATHYRRVVKTNEVTHFVSEYVLDIKSTWCLICTERELVAVEQNIGVGDAPIREHIVDGGDGDDA